MRTRNRLGGVALVLLAMGAHPLLAQGEEHVSDRSMQQLLQILHRRGSISDQEYEELKGSSKQPPTSPTPIAAPVAPTAVVPAQAAPAAAVAGTEKTAEEKPKVEEAKKPTPWYDKLAIRGYVQVRHHSILSHEGADLNVPADRSVSETNTFLIRRGRVILFGDVSDHLYVYAQTDMNASPTSGDFSLQMRDLYADIAIDKAKEFRFRVGQSKIPFGWVNLQSSQNRAPVERPDAINSAAEGERDIGAFFYWAPAAIRARFRTLVSSGLRGSGDYGVFGFGAYSGQGPNRQDLNGDPHYIARLSYPFELPNGQFVELGAQAYTGRFVAKTQAITLSDNSKVTPGQHKNGAADERIGATFVWYPQPFGIEAEWNFGHGPQISDDYKRIESRGLHGGYVQASYRLQNLRLSQWELGEATPFIRWNFFDGGRKFGTNAGPDLVNEIDIGTEWQPFPALELLLAYTPTFTRTNTDFSANPTFQRTEDAHRIGVQVQFNY